MTTEATKGCVEPLKFRLYGRYTPRTCANCNTLARCRWSCTCLKAGKEKKGEHGKFYFCSLRCLGQHHKEDYGK